MKTFILDTNVLLHDYKSLFAFEDNKTVIPLVVLDELDHAKTRPDEQGRNARHVIRALDELRLSGSLSKGVSCKKCLIKVELNNQDKVAFLGDKPDNRIISVALALKEKKQKVIVVTKDINLRVKCDVLGIEAQDYNKDKLKENIQEIYPGHRTVEVSPAEIDMLYNTGSINLNVENPYQNEFFLVKANNQSAITRYKNDSFSVIKPVEKVFSIRPRNVEQKMAFDLLLDRNVSLVSLIGLAGAGKTLIATAAALAQTIDKTYYSRIVISRPVQPMGRDIGFLPGTIDEKLAPWMQPIYDSLELLLGNDANLITEYKYNGTIQVEPLTYIRGRSIPKSFIILDESQNLSVHEIKTIITRVGEGTKIVLTGDIAQIDQTNLDFANNGLTHVVERFKKYSLSGHITLRKGERSELATLASEVL